LRILDAAPKSARIGQSVKLGRYCALEIPILLAAVSPKPRWTVPDKDIDLPRLRPIIAEMRLALPQLCAFAGCLPLDAAPVQGMDEGHCLVEVGYGLRESAAGGT